MPRLSPEQLADRHTGLGATDVVEVALAAIGQVPWADAGPMRVYARKKGLLPETPETPEMAWGHTMEDVYLAWYERETGEKLLPGGSIRSPDEPWLWATIDGKVLSRSCIVEAKNVGRWMSRGWDTTREDGIPHHVRAQVVIGMFCSGVRWADVVAGIAGMPPQIWRVPYDEKLAEMLVSAGRTFWSAHVLANVPPPLDDSDACRRYLEATYPSPADPVILDAGAEADRIAQTRIAAACVRESAEKTVRIADAELMACVGGASGIQGAGWKFTWKLDKNGRRATRFTVKGTRDE